MIIDDREKKGGGRIHYNKCREFRDTISYCRLLDMGYRGNKFTWNKINIFQGLDRVLCNFEWQNKFQQAYVRHLPEMKSDHAPLLISWYRNNQINQNKNKPFRFQAAWNTHPNFKMQSLFFFLIRCRFGTKMYLAIS
jgi:hypothetical protein